MGIVERLRERAALLAEAKDICDFNFFFKNCSQDTPDELEALADLVEAELWLKEIGQVQTWLITERPKSPAIYETMLIHGQAHSEMREALSRLVDHVCERGEK